MILVSAIIAHHSIIPINSSDNNATKTAKLKGMQFNTAIVVICKSMGLEYSINDSVYALKSRFIEQP